jgi:nicotinamidase-related amidase
MAERVWERYLSDEDRAYLSRIQRQPVGFGSHPALLLVDLYRKVFGDKPEPLLEGIKSWPKSKGLVAWRTLPHIQTLLAKAREVGFPVIHTTGLDWSDVEGWRGGRSLLPGADTAPGAEERLKRQYEIIDEVAPLPGEVVIEKASPSAFLGTPLLGYLTFLGVDTLITCGETTSGCVRASVVDGFSYRFRMIVVEDCVFDRHDVAQAMNLFDMHRKYADVLPLTEVLKYLETWSARRAGEGGARASGQVG